MKKYQSQRLFLTQEELQRIHMLATKSVRQNSKPRFKEKPKTEQYQFKPEINKQSSNLQRSITDLYRWNQNKNQRIQQIYDEETKELINNANKLTHELTQSSVFERLYQVRKNSENFSQLQRRNTHNIGPYYTKNMTHSMYQEYQKLQQVENSQMKNKTFATDSKHDNSQMTPQTVFFDSEQLPIAMNDQMRTPLPIHEYVDITEQVEDSINEPDSPAKSPLHQKDIEVMVERLNNWQAKKQLREQQLQDEIVFKQQQQKSVPINQNRQPSFGIQSQQSQSKTYANMFLNNNQIS